VTSTSPEQTRELGRRIGLAAQPGDVVAVCGPLGAGKTCLVQGLALGLGVASSVAVASPTFSLVHEYPGRLRLYHMDFYRLGAGEADRMGLEEILESDGVSVAEWAERWPWLLEAADAVIRLEGRGGQRTLHLEAAQKRFVEAWEPLAC
jgi:tRNA threonylcarbamoyladenosine biosynthesis protein TsaE